MLAPATRIRRAANKAMSALFGLSGSTSTEKNFRTERAWMICSELFSRLGAADRSVLTAVGACMFTGDLSGMSPQTSGPAMHPDLEAMLSTDIFELTPLELVTALLFSGLPVRITVNTPQPDRLDLIYKDLLQVCFPVCVLATEERITIGELSTSGLVRFPSSYVASNSIPTPSTSE